MYSSRAAKVPAASHCNAAVAHRPERHSRAGMTDGNKAWPQRCSAGRVFAACQVAPGGASSLLLGLQGRVGLGPRLDDALPDRVALDQSAVGACVLGHNPQAQQVAPIVLRRKGGGAVAAVKVGVPQ